jgi:hypothetical protein
MAPNSQRIAFPISLALAPPVSALQLDIPREDMNATGGASASVHADDHDPACVGELGPTVSRSPDWLLVPVDKAVDDGAKAFSFPA